MYFLLDLGEFLLPCCHVSLLEGIKSIRVGMAGPRVLGFVKKVVDDKRWVVKYFFQFRIWWDLFFFGDEFPSFFNQKSWWNSTKFKLLDEILRMNLLINIQHRVVFVFQIIFTGAGFLLTVSKQKYNPHRTKALYFKVTGKMIFLFHRRDILVPRGVCSMLGTSESNIFPKCWLHGNFFIPEKESVNQKPKINKSNFSSKHHSWPFLHQQHKV